MTAGWRGVIEEYRDFLPVTDAHARSSPCSRAARRCCRRPASPSGSAPRCWLKVEGANPTGCFKDRGMTMAISKAVEEGAKAVVCASTGNTSASAAAYAAAGRPRLRRAHPRRPHRPRASWPRRSSTAPGCCRCAATSTSR